MKFCAFQSNSGFFKIRTINYIFIYILFGTCSFAEHKENSGDHESGVPEATPTGFCVFFTTGFRGGVKIREKTQPEPVSSEISDFEYAE